MDSRLALIFVVLAGTAMWPVNRWAMRTGARPAALGIAISTIGLPLSLLLAYIMHSPIFVPSALILGSIGAIAFAVGFVLIIFHCLKIGPAGLTVTVNNMGLMWPVITGMLWFSKSPPPVSQWVGLALTLVSLVLVGFLQRDPGAKTTINPKWVTWVFAGWVLSGISMNSQFLNSRYAPHAPFAYLTALYGISLLLFVIILLVKRQLRLTRTEWLAGACVGFLITLSLPATLWALLRLSAAIVYPITVAGPILLMLIISHFAMKERLGYLGWAAGLLGVGGVVLLCR